MPTFNSSPADTDNAMTLAAQDPVLGNIAVSNAILIAILVVVASLFSPGQVVAEGEQIEEDESVYRFTEADIEFLENFSLSKLPELPLAPDNRVADNLQAAQLGYRIFFDSRFSANKSVSCASCHQAEKYFSDGLPVSVGIGKTHRNAPSIAGAIYGQWFYWDGRKDSLWSQALAPFEHVDEQQFSRLEVAQTVLTFYAESYADVYGTDPNVDELLARLLSYATPASPVGRDSSAQNWAKIPTTDQTHINRVFSNVGKALMAYERKLTLSSTRFDRFVDLLAERKSNIDELRKLLTIDEVEGMRLFMGLGNCASCHNGPLFSNQEFHNIGAPEADTDNVDLGRYAAIDQLLMDEFTCLSQWSDATAESCDEMNYLKRTGPELVGAFKTPSLRNIAETAPYMQQGQFKTLNDVVAHYNKPTPPFYDRAQHPNRPHFDILPLNLSDKQQNQLVAFLRTLTSKMSDLDPTWWTAPGSGSYQ